MKAISLWQPWASAVALGYKSIETRHWSTTYRGPIAIHAAQRWTADERDFAQSVAHRLYDARLIDPPRGVIVAVADLVKIQPTDEVRHRLRGTIEADLGNYGDGRFAWRLERIRAIPTPIPARGFQALFNIDDALFEGAWS